MSEIFSVASLSTALRSALRIVDEVSFSINHGETFALLGESGCGKSMTALSLMRLLPDDVRIEAGSARLAGTDILALPERDMRTVRGGRLAMIFQEPMTSLNPVLSIGAQIRESSAAHRGLGGAAALAEAERLMAAVGLPGSALADYPFQLSGGQRQRALIAMMLAGAPSVLVADEPTTALDVTVQAQILGLLRGLRRERGMGLLLITHDLDVARDMADRVAVMYAGQIVEWAARDRLYGSPFHPFTRRLFEVLTTVGKRGRRLAQSPAEAVQVQEVAVTQGAGSTYRAHLTDLGAKLSRLELQIALTGAKTETNLSGVQVLSGGRHADVTTRLGHAVGDTESVQLFKHVVAGKSRAVYQGRITVEEGADGTDSRQTAKALLLDDRAEADLKPELIIFADDVKCAHGAAVGDLDADSLFYLRARGIPEAEARGMLMRAFLEDAVSEIENEAIRAAVWSVVEAALVHAGAAA